MRPITFSPVVLGLLVAFGNPLLALATGGISGQVLDADSGAPIPCEVNALTTDNDWVESAWCDASGAYAFTALAAGEYVLVTTVPDHPEYVELWYDDTLYRDEATPVSVVDGQTVSGIDFRLPVGGTVSGHVRANATGVGIAGAYVEVFLPPEWRWSRSVETGADGSYEITGVPAGSYMVEAWVETGPFIPQYWDHVLIREEGTAITFEGHETVTGIDFDLLREATVGGTVVDARDGAPIADAFVEAYSINSDYGSNTFTGPDGTFTIGQLPPGSYVAGADADAYGYAFLVDDDGNPEILTLAEGDQLTGLTIRLTEGGAISGHVVRASDGSPVVNGWVFAWQPDYAGDGSASTDPEGFFRIEGLPPGPYSIAAEGTEGENLVPQTYSDAEGNPITVTVTVGDEVSGILFELEEGGFVSGTVVAEASGEPLAGVPVMAELINGNGGRSGTSGGDGSFLISGLAEGDYLVSAAHPDYVYQAFDGALFPEQGTPVPVEVGETTGGIAFSLARAGHVTGTVVSAANGDPLDSVAVAAYLREDLGVPAAWGVTDPTGRYDLGSVPPGEPVYLLAYDWMGRYAWQWYPDALLFGDASPVATWPETPFEGADFALDPPGATLVSHTSFEFAAQNLQEDIPPQRLTVTNPGPGPNAVWVWGDGDWLWTSYDESNPVLEAGQSLPVDVYIWAYGLNPGTYTAAIHIWDYFSDRELMIPVTLTVTESPPVLELSEGELWFEAAEGAGDPEPQRLYVANLGGGELTVSAASSVPWATVSLPSHTLRRGEDPAELVVAVSAGALEPGTHTGLVTLATSAGDRAISLQLDLEPAPDGVAELVVPEQLTINVPGGGKTPVTTTFQLANSGDGTLYWSSRLFDDWVQLDPAWGEIAAGSEPTTATLTVEPSSLANGMATTFVKIACSAEAAWIEVRVVVGDDLAATAGVTASVAGQLVVPVVVHAPGLHGSEFVSDVWIAHRPSGQPATATIAFIPFGADGSEQAYTTTLTFESGQTISMLDIVQNWAAGPKSDKGSLVIISDSIDEFEATSRTYNVATQKKDGGQTTTQTFGQEVPGVSSQDGIGRLEGSLHVPGLTRSASFRSNLLLTEVSGQSVEAGIELFDASGTSLGQTQVTVPPFSVTQLTDVFQAVGVTGDVQGARAEVGVAEGDGRLVVLGSVVDNTTNDPTTVAGVRKDAETQTTVVPVVAHTAGVAGTRWVSDVVVANVDTAPRVVTFTYHDISGQTVGSRTQTVAAGHSLVMSDVVGTTFGQESSRGSLAVSCAPVGGLAITSRTYNQGAVGTYGQGVSGTTAANQVSQGSDLLRLIALHNTSSYRTNVGVVETSGLPAVVGITLFDSVGDEVLGYREVSLPAHGQHQSNVFDAMGLETVNVVAATAVIQVIEGSGSVTAYASMVDNATGDGTTLPPPVRVGTQTTTVPGGG